jgi:signal transduction histidine kinase
VGVHGLTQLLHKQYYSILDEKGKKYCTQILKASSEIVALVDKINAYIKMKETALTIEKVQLKAVLEMLKSEFSIQLAERNIRWVEPDFLPEVMADRLSLTRVFRNFVDNALKYGGPGLSEVRIGHTEDEKFHIFSVSDDGVGIQQEDADKLFRPFQRQATSKGIEGTGLGLAIVKDIAEKQGGRVWVEPGPEKGAVFFITIPK